jgi:MinD-like ATPase involved in chromosome partitioning or flagellar assembly
MARHDESTERRNGLYTDAELGTDDAWPETPEPSWLTGVDEAHDEAPSDPFADTQNIPSYDLGPHTESVVVDLTSPTPPPPIDLTADLTDPPSASWADEPAQGYDSGDQHTQRYDSDDQGYDSGDQGYDSGDQGYDSGVQQTQSYDQLTPEASAPAPTRPAPDPTNSRHSAPDTSYVPIAKHEPVPEWGIPPVPAGRDLKGAESLTAASILRAPAAKPTSGWRKTVLTMTGGRLNLGLSPAEEERADQMARARTPVKGSHRVAVISLKGGVGKTTTTAALGSMFAQLRGDRVIAVDANPDRGTLSERVTRESGATIRHLLMSRDRLTRYGDVRAFTSQSPTRLEVLASDSDPSASSALSEQDYIDTLDTLERFYNLVLTDCGTGLLHDAMRGVLGLASSLVVVSSASLDGARSASATLDWLEAHGLGTLAKNAVVVISSVRPGGGIVDVLQLEDHFASRCRAVVTIPYDPHLEAGSALDIDELNEGTREAYLELAAAVGEGFALAPSSR